MLRASAPSGDRHRPAFGVGPGGRTDFRPGSLITDRPV
jgi:hypothetical protein